MFVYRNASSGQVIESEHVLPHLDGLARWERSEVERKPAPEPTPEPATEQDEPTPAPRKSTRNRKASK